MNKRILGVYLIILTLFVMALGCSSQSASNNAAPAAQDAKTEAQPKTETKTETKTQPAEKAADPVVLKLGHGTSTTSLYHLGSEKFKELVEAKTNGAIKVEIHSDGSIGHDKDLINYMKMGTVQAGMIGVEPLVGIAPKFAVIGLPYIFPTRDAAYKVLDGELGAEMAAELPKNHGMRILGYFENGFRNVSNSKNEVISPADLAGLKLRTPQSPVSLAIFKALGANPTPMSFGELYTALEQKTVDGQENPLAIIYFNKLHEVQKYISLTGHMYSPMVLAISEKTWGELSAEQQKAVQEAANEARDYERKLSADQEADLISKLKAEGVQVTEVDPVPFIEATKDVHLEFDAEYGADFYQKIVDQTK
jgi:tripartite ATP-independent transporter DctP family solute receptor